ncbi:UDP-Glycosyltransferase/glycogen phosphorylase [Dendrothele bispora CBS 962.96]|uniref:UDP-Glycosyltransferase/glycogen phosphorylase n=1 Tax=Dendrothele bispora (strain CBS 962.96) TaxID=1314807 RepID=A0A4S8MHD2_DENBC|nr:UDP-Glycosyltransferase/glycogen phosphorylase [Dendrothele bispora CBS 962.96]
MAIPLENQNQQSSTSKKNIFFYCIPAWGHTKPIPAFGYRILETTPDTIITVFTFSAMYPRLLKEIEKVPREYRKRFFVIDVCGPVFNPQLPLQEFELAFEALWTGKPITCLSSGKIWTGIPKPVVAVVDPFAGYAIEAVRDVTLPSETGRLPVVAWFTAPIGPALRLFGPREIGGIGLSGKLDMKMVRNATEKEIALRAPEFAPQKNGQVVSIPGVPEMYDYEWDPQEIPIVPTFMEEVGRLYFSVCDGLLSVTGSAYEGGAIDTARRWCHSLGHDVYPIGPLLGVDDEEKEKKASSGVITVEDKTSTKAQAVEFLDRMQEKYGKKSVIYMSFGTLFWPVDEQKLWAVIEELLANETPVIFAHPSPFMKAIDEKKLAILKQSPIGMEFQYAPQEAILMHPATGWFISHGGWNSTQEGFMYKVPQIFWPFAGDQPYNAALMSQVHKAGFELINVRTGRDGTQPPYRHKDAPVQPTFTVEAVRAEVRDLLLKLKGDEGAVVRKNYENLGKTFLTGWDKDGEARASMEAFIKEFVH